jgi:hypothetical protein
MISDTLMTEWDHKKNLSLGLDPTKLTAQSNKQAHWLCEHGHSWKKRIQSRTLYNSGCPTCKSLGFLYPELTKEIFDPKSQRVHPFEIPAGSNKKLEWICSKGHRWKCAVYLRVKSSYINKAGDRKGSGCPECGNKKVGKDNNLLFINPDLCKEWDYEKNTIQPNEILAGSHKKVWWKCSKGHSFQTVVKDRCFRGTGCGRCSAQTSRPEIRIIAELSTVFGEIQPRGRVDKIWIDALLKTIKVAVEYDGEFYHKPRLDKDVQKNNSLEKLGYQVIRFREGDLQKISDNDIQVPVNGLHKIHIDALLQKLRERCNNESINRIDEYLESPHFLNDQRFNELVAAMPGAILEQSMGHLHPDLLDSWDYEQNAPISPFEVFPHSAQKVHWTCEHDHQWQAPIAARVTGNGCPFCRGTYASPQNNLRKLYPQVADSFHQELNGKITPDKITPKSNTEYWWQCSVNIDHVWKAQVNSRTNKNSGCPYCSGNKLSPENSLATKCPWLIHEWDFELNKSTPNEVSFGSGEKVHWVCSSGHHWKAAIQSRASGKGCAVCAGKKTIRETSLGYLHSDIVDQLANKNSIDVFKLSPGSHKKVLWRCMECNLEWEASIRRRVGYAGKKPSGCPKCSKKNSHLNFAIKKE